MDSVFPPFPDSIFQFDKGGNADGEEVLGSDLEDVGDVLKGFNVFTGMDKVQRPESLAFISPIISPRAFYNEFIFSEIFRPPIVFDPEKKLEGLAALLGTTLEVTEDLQKLMDNIQDLKEDVEDGGPLVSDTIPQEGIKPDTALATLLIQKEELEKRKRLPYRQGLSTVLKYRRVSFGAAPQKAAKRERPLPMIDVCNYVPPSTVMTLYVMRPYNKCLEHHEIRLGRLLSMDYVLLLHGENTLKDVVEAIECQSNYAVCREDRASGMGESDYHMDVSGDTKWSKERYKSRFVYINGVFYNHVGPKPHNTDLTLPIREWAARHSGDIGSFGTGSLGTRVEDVRLRLGHPYLYQHQGSCQHLLVFTDLRLLHPDDPQALSTYPVVLSEKLKKRHTCVGCKVQTAKFVQYGNKRTPMTPAFWCEKCLLSFNYDEKKNKVSHFDVVPYTDRTGLR